MEEIQVGQVVENPGCVSRNRGSSWKTRGMGLSINNRQRVARLELKTVEDKSTDRRYSR